VTFVSATGSMWRSLPWRNPAGVQLVRLKPTNVGTSELVVFAKARQMGVRRRGPCEARARSVRDPCETEP
jgi:hypothetical protein